MMDLRFTNNTKPTINLEEDLYIAGWSIIEAEVYRLHDLSWTYQKKGREDLGDLYVKSANYHVYLLYYALFLRNFLDSKGLIDNRCDSTELNENTKILCVEKNLPCLSSDLKTDYITSWNNLLSEFGISRQTEGCETDCCLGIGEAIINDPNDCIAYIVGDCSENITENIEGLGEYEDCTYDDSHTTGETEPC